MILLVEGATSFLVVDWSDAQIKGLQHAIGKEKAEQLQKGCKVHWLRSCQRIAEKLSRSHDRSRERNVFESIAKCIPHLKSAVQVIACLRKAALHSDRTAQHGPPDRVSNFVCDGVRALKQSSKQKSAPNPCIVQPGTKKKAITALSSAV